MLQSTIYVPCTKGNVFIDVSFYRERKAGHTYYYVRMQPCTREYCGNGIFCYRYTHIYNVIRDCMHDCTRHSSTQENIAREIAREMFVLMLDKVCIDNDLRVAPNYFKSNIDFNTITFKVR